MRRKQIIKRLNYKIESLAKYIESFCDKEKLRDGFEKPYSDAGLADDVRAGTIITGGAIVSFLMQDEPNDYDCYFESRDLAFRVAGFFLWVFRVQTGKTADNGMVAEDAQDMYLSYTVSEERKEFGKYYPTSEGIPKGAAPGVGRFKVVIKSSGVASTQEDVPSYEYFEGDVDGEATKDFVEAVTDTDEVLQGSTRYREAVKKKGWHHPLFLTANAISLAGDIQLITRFYGSPEEIHANYDFIHCCCWYHSGEKRLELPAEALEAILGKTLVYCGSLYPLCSIIRIRKFVARGWRINAGQILKMIFQVSEMDLSDISVLEDQLVGVDAAYFQEIIDELRKKQDEDIAAEVADGKDEVEARKSHKGVDGTYLATLIDKIF